jgi:multiple antibiotic resistance protein
LAQSAPDAAEKAMPLEFAISALVTLLVVVDPIGLAPTFLAVTEGLPRGARRNVALRASVIAGVILIGTALIGDWLFRALSISLPAFRIAGGVLLFLLGLDMARGDLATSLADGTGSAAGLSARDYALAGFERLVVPFAMPLLIGPGAISTAVIYAGEAGRLGFAGEAAGIVVIFAIAVSILASFWFAGLITRILGRVGMIIVIRVLGLILCAMAVQFIMIGIADSTVGLLRPSAATPYPR